MNDADETADRSADRGGPARAEQSTEAEIRRLLDANGGRLKQQRIIDETGLSDASVSRYLTSLERAGDLKRVRTGRENVVVLLDRTDARERRRRHDDRRNDAGE